MSSDMFTDGVYHELNRNLPTAYNNSFLTILDGMGLWWWRSRIYNRMSPLSLYAEDMTVINLLHSFMRDLEL